jgi:hypothetical protein
MSVLKQHLHVTQERYATPHGTRPPTHLLSTNPPMRRLARIDPFQCHGRRTASFHRQRPRQRRAVRWPLMSAMHSDAVATILTPRADKGEHLQRTAEAAAGTLHPGDHDCGSAHHHHQRGTALTRLATATAGAPTSSSPTQRPHGASLDTSRNPRTSQHSAYTPDQGRSRGCCQNAAEQHKTPRHVLGNASPDARAADDAGGGILCMTKDFRARERQRWNPRPQTTTEHDWPEGLGTDPTPAPTHSNVLTYMLRKLSVQSIGCCACLEVTAECSPGL